AQRTRENKSKISSNEFETSLLQKRTSFQRRDQNRIFIEWTARDNVTRRRIPGIVLPESKETTWLQCIANQSKGFMPLLRCDVMKYAIAIGKIHLPFSLQIGDSFVADLLASKMFARNFQ